MECVIENPFDCFCELRGSPGLEAPLLTSQQINADLLELIEEAYVAGVLREQLPSQTARIMASVKPVWQQMPLVQQIEIALAAQEQNRTYRFAQQFRSGNWKRSAQRQLLQLREEGSLAADEQAHLQLVALPQSRPVASALELEPPLIDDATLADCGVLRLGDGALTPDRPILVNARFAEDAIRHCVASGTIESGGAALGRLVRLPEPLPGAATRVVTILTAIVTDVRHIGTATRFHLSPAALEEAHQMCLLRGLGEHVITVFHTHGWSSSCGNCNQNAECPLAESAPSLHDYEQLTGQLFRSKATVLPIAGRKLGEAGRSPVLQVHAWRRGELRPLRWQTYHD